MIPESIEVALLCSLTAAEFLALLFGARVCVVRASTASPRVQWLQTCILVGWAGFVIFSGLGALGAFRTWPVLVATLTVVGGCLAFARRYAQPLGEPTTSGQSAARPPISRSELVVGFAVVLAILLVSARAFALPALAWDDLTYHLFRAARWVTRGAIAPDSEPDAAGYYEFFPLVGDALWAWVMLAPRNDVLVSWASLGVWLSIAGCLFVYAREGGVARVEAIWRAAAIATLPAHLSALGTAYVDNLTLALVLCGLVLLGPALTRGAGGVDAFSAGAAFGLAAGCKWPAIVFVGGATVASIAAVIRRRVHWSSLLWFFGGASGGLTGFLRAWWFTGNPFYPLEIAGVWRGNELFVRTMQRAGDSTAHGSLLASLVQEVFFALPPGWGDWYAGFAPVGCAVLVVAVVSAVRARSTWTLTEWVAVIAGTCLLASLLAPSHQPLIRYWPRVFARHATTALAGYWLLWMRATGTSVAPRLAMLCCVSNLVYLSLPGWGGFTRSVLLVLGMMGVGAAGAYASLRALPNRWRASVIWVLGVVIVAGLVLVRESAREETWNDGSAAYQLHPVTLPPQLGTLAAMLDGAAGLRVAFAGDASGHGHTWFRYPMTGHRLQNEVGYVPATADGSTPSYFRARQATDADREAWLCRLRDARIERVVLQGSALPERRWVEQVPDVFVRTFIAASTESPAESLLAVRVNQGRLAERCQRSGVR